jgi:hypothetical protein
MGRTMKNLVVASAMLSMGVGSALAKAAEERPMMERKAVRPQPPRVPSAPADPFGQNRAARRRREALARKHG